LLVRPPEITTFRPAVDGSGEDAIVSAPGVHGVVQQAVVQQAVVQQAVVQQVPDCAQHVFDCTQQTVEVDPRSGASTGVGQHGGTIAARSRCCGHTMRRALPAAPAGPSNASPHSEAARKSSDGTIRRRIAKDRRRAYPYFVKANAVLAPRTAA
jgi:hypothetical protein